VSLHAGGLALQVEAFRDLMIYRQDRIEVIGPERLGRWVPDMVERGFEGILDCVRTRRCPGGCGPHPGAGGGLRSGGEPCEV